MAKTSDPEFDPTAPRLSVFQQDELTVAARYNFTAKPDPNRGEGWHRFERDFWHVWRCQRGWAIAALEDGRYSRHEYEAYSDLDAAFRNAIRRSVLTPRPLPGTPEALDLAAKLATEALRRPATALEAEPLDNLRERD